MNGSLDHYLSDCLDFFQIKWMIGLSSIWLSRIFLRWMDDWIISESLRLYLIIQLSSQIGLNLMIQSSINLEKIIDSQRGVHLMIQWSIHLDNPSDNAPSISFGQILCDHPIIQSVGLNLMIQSSIHLEIILDSQIGALSNDPMIHSSGKDSR